MQRVMLNHPLIKDNLQKSIRELLNIPSQEIQTLSAPAQSLIKKLNELSR